MDKRHIKNHYITSLMVIIIFQWTFLCLSSLCLSFDKMNRDFYYLFKYILCVHLVRRPNSFFTSFYSFSFCLMRQCFIIISSASVYFNIWNNDNDTCYYNIYKSFFFLLLERIETQKYTTLSHGPIILYIILRSMPSFLFR